MSQFYDQASLVMVPSGYKTGKVYSQKPLSTDGELTFTRASSATRVGPDGLIEKVRTNLILQSNSFDTTWILSNATATSGQSGYDGSSDATLVAATGTFSRTYQNVSGSGVYTGSVYVKAGTASWVLLRIQGTNNNQLYVNLSDGTYNVSGGDVISQKVNSIGSGWYRLELSINTSLVTFNVYPALGNADLGTSNETIYIQDAQLEAGDIATDYIATTSAAVSVGPVANVPRLDYLGSSCGKLLLEPQRQNLVTFSEQMDNAAWNKNILSVTANQTTSPDGYTNADLIDALTGTGQHFISAASIGYTNAVPYTFSVFAKKGNTSLIQLFGASGVFTVNVWASYNFDTLEVTTGSAATASMVDYGSGWYRLILTGTVTVASTVASFYAAFTNDKSVRLPSFTAANQTFYLFGAQTEQASYATSYINTLNSAVTRLADSASKTGISSLIGQSEGTLYWEGYVTPAGEWNSLLSVEVLGAVFINLRLNPSNQIELGSGNLGSEIVITGSTPLSSGTYYKIAGAYKSGQNVLYVNGVQIGTSATTFTTPTLTDFRFNVWNVFDEQKRTAQALLFKTRLSNAQLAELTTL